MPIDNDYTNHSDVLILISEAQSNEKEQRASVEESHNFITKKDGMWDEDSWNKMEGRFRGTFDMLTPIVDGIAGEITKADFSIRVNPANGVATKSVAKTFDGLIRNIRNVSNADQLFNDMARANVIGGFDACEIVQDTIEPDSFNQDLLIKKISNAVRSVWWDQGSIEQDRHDADWGIKLVTILKSKYDDRWPDGGGVSIGDNATVKLNRTTKVSDTVTIGKLYYKKPMNIEIVMMTNGKTYEDNKEFKSVKDELAIPTEENPKGVFIELDDKGEEKRRTVKQCRVYSRLLDGEDWLDDEEETVFDYVPLIPIYGNFTIINDQYVYFGKIRNLYDQQRVLNYATSRDIEDGALGPSEKIAMTTKQIGDNDYSGINTERDPIFEYDNDPDAKTPPFKMAGAQPSSALQTTIAGMQQMIGLSSNTFQAQQGNATSTQSGVAGLQQIEQANIGSIKWFTPVEIMYCHIARIIINAAPRVYDSTRITRILEEDGSSKFIKLNEKVFNRETNTNVVLNDLSIGRYDAVCKAGPAFNSSQKESARAIEAIMTINPQLAAENMDIYLRNKQEPGFDLMADRERVKLFNAGLIPEEQWTDEEKQKVAEQQAQAEQQPPQEDPNMLLARAEEGKAQADILTAQTKQQESQFNAQVKTAEIKLEQEKIALEREKLQLDVAKFQREKDDKFNVDAANINQGQQKIDQDNQKMLIAAHQNQDKIDQNQFELLLKSQNEQQKQVMEAQAAMAAEIKTNAESFKIIADSMQTFVGTGIVEAGIKQADIIQESQEKVMIFNTDLGDFEDDS